MFDNKLTFESQMFDQSAFRNFKNKRSVFYEACLLFQSIKTHAVIQKLKILLQYVIDTL